MPKRGLSIHEIHEAQLVFAGNLEVSRIVIHEEAKWPDRIAAIGAALHSSSPPTHNAITLGNHIYFPVQLSTGPDKPEDLALQAFAWLIHELTHSWQFQQRGIISFFEALWVQIRMGSAAYAYGWESGLNAAYARGDSFDFFNPEQQADITRHYYYRLKKGLGVSAWEPWIQAIKVAL